MFSLLTGNEQVKATLRHLISIGRVPSSLLFAGPEGVGKKEFAIDLARSFVCQNTTERLACGECAACRRVGAFNTPTSEKGEDYDHVFFGEHGDVGLVIPYKRNLRVGAIRALEREANFRPYEARARVFILDDADKMNDAAANALLKTLEEPPSTTHIVLVSSRPAALLATIRSRCQTIRFAPVSEREIATLLSRQRSFSEKDARLAARIAKGSVARALSFDIAGYRSRRGELLDLINKALIQQNRSALIRGSEQLNDAKHKELYEETLETLETLVRDLWLLKNGSDADVINIDIAGDLDTLAASVSTDKLAATLSEIELLRQSLFVNINRKVATDALFMKMSA